MRERYEIVNEGPTTCPRADGSTVVLTVFAVVDRRTPELPICWCFSPNDASKIATALNHQYRDGAERRAARKAHA